jgi:hypothetical protein
VRSGRRPLRRSRHRLGPGRVRFHVLSVGKLAVSARRSSVGQLAVNARREADGEAKKESPCGPSGAALQEEGGDQRTMIVA